MNYLRGPGCFSPAPASPGYYDQVIKARLQEVSCQQTINILTQVDWEDVKDGVLGLSISKEDCRNYLGFYALYVTLIAADNKSGLDGIFIKVAERTGLKADDAATLYSQAIRYLQESQTAKDLVREAPADGRGRPNRALALLHCGVPKYCVRPIWDAIRAAHRKNISTADCLRELSSDMNEMLMIRTIAEHYRMPNMNYLRDIINIISEIGAYNDPAVRDLPPHVQDVFDAIGLETYPQSNARNIRTKASPQSYYLRYDDGEWSLFAGREEVSSDTAPNPVRPVVFDYSYQQVSRITQDASDAPVYLLIHDDYYKWAEGSTGQSLCPWGAGPDKSNVIHEYSLYRVEPGTHPVMLSTADGVSQYCWYKPEPGGSPTYQNGHTTKFYPGIYVELLGGKLPIYRRPVFSSKPVVVYFTQDDLVAQKSAIAIAGEMLRNGPLRVGSNFDILEKITQHAKDAAKNLGISIPADRPEMIPCKCRIEAPGARDGLLLLTAGVYIKNLGLVDEFGSESVAPLSRIHGQIPPAFTHQGRTFPVDFSQKRPRATVTCSGLDVSIQYEAPKMCWHLETGSSPRSGSAGREHDLYLDAKIANTEARWLNTVSGNRHAILEVGYSTSSSPPADPASWYRPHSEFSINPSCDVGAASRTLVGAVRGTLPPQAGIYVRLVVRLGGGALAIVPLFRMSVRRPASPAPRP